MLSEATLFRVAGLHTLLVATLALAVATAGFSVKGVAFGGGAMALSFAILWGTSRVVFGGRHGALVASLASLKVLLYLGLAATVLSGRLVVDGGGFAAGVSCFLVAVISVALLEASRKRTA